MQSQTLVGAEFSAARRTDEHLLGRIGLTLVHLRMELQGLGSREALIAMIAAIVATQTSVHAKVSQFGELLRALIAFVHS